jgi:cytochrome d ubiquinol oxidase subunit II
MTLSEAPLILILLGLGAFAVLGGADFGAGFWQLLSGGSDDGRALRDHAHRAMGPVWEANNVWLIFVLVVCWTAYPTAFASIFSTLAAALFLAAIGLILRGTTYVLRSGAERSRTRRGIDLAFATSSILTPFALGAAVGGIASGRVPVGNAQGDLVTSWLNPTSIAIGVIAVASGAYLAAVYLAGDAVRIGSPGLARAFRARALGAGLVAGAAAFAALPVLRWDARPVWDGLTSGWGLVALAASAVAGVVALALVARSRFEASRVSAALAVACVVAGWAIAQRPELLPGLTVDEAAAGRSTLIAVLVGTAIGALVLVPSLALLFGLFLHGTLDEHGTQPSAVPRPAPTQAAEAAPAPQRRPPLVAPALACLVVGTALTLLADGGWALALGLVLLFAFIVLAFGAIALPAGPASSRS